MLKKYSQLFEVFFTASDLFMASLAWILSYWVRFSSGLYPVDKGIPDFGDYFRMLLFVWLIWGFVFRKFGLYKPMRGVKRLRELWLVIKANSFAVVLLLALTYLFREKSVPFSRLVFVIFFVLSTVSLAGSRHLIRSFLRFMRRKGYNLRYSLIVGNGKLAGNVASRILNHPEYGIELVGCLASDSIELNEEASKHLPDGARIIGRYSDIAEVLQQGSVDQVVVALPLSDHDQIEKVASLIGDTIVDVRIVPDLHQFIQLGSQIEDFDGLPVVCVASTPLSGINRVAKRILDLILAFPLLVFLSPLMVFLGMIVKITSRGPVLFSQERVGLDGRTFNIYKFRTMAVNAEQDGAKFAVPDDPRTTVLGKFLRRSNLDELPQLVNVILGHMSLVGPRPERPVFIREFRRRVPKYMLRHKVQAGMTGWAQVNGWRGNTSIERRIEHDLYYIEHWSLLLDLKILFLTLLNSFRDRNAY